MFYNPINLIEIRNLNDNDDISNLYVKNKTLFKNDKNMVIKDVDGSIEKYEIKKIYPIDEKDKRIEELENQIKELKEVIYEYPKHNETINDSEQPNSNVSEYVKPKSKKVF